MQDFQHMKNKGQRNNGRSEDQIQREMPEIFNDVRDELVFMNEKDGKTPKYPMEFH